MSSITKNHSVSPSLEETLISLLVSPTTEPADLQLVLPHGLSTLRAKVVAQGGFSSMVGRSVLWRIALGVLPIRINEQIAPFALLVNHWYTTVIGQRKQYVRLKEKLMIDPTSETPNDQLGDPLSTNKNSIWAKYHENQDFLDIIKKDLNRLYPCGCEPVDLFQNPSYQQILQNVLFVWSKTHPEISYRQGMHEIVAPVLYVLNADANCATDGPVMAEVASLQHLEHDVYMVFAGIMEAVAPLYSVGNSSGMSAPLQQTDVLNCAGPHGEETLAALAPVLRLAAVVQQNILSAINPILCSKLNSLKIEPQLYVLRWSRLMFVREFPMPQSLRIWDFVFLYSGGSGRPFDLHVLALICCAMVDGLSSALETADHTKALTLLMKYDEHMQTSDQATITNLVAQVLCRAVAIDRQLKAQSQGRGTQHSGPNVFQSSNASRNTPSRLPAQANAGKASEGFVNQAVPMRPVAQSSTSRIGGIRLQNSESRQREKVNGFSSYLHSIGAAIEEVGSGIIQTAASKAPPIIDSLTAKSRGKGMDSSSSKRSDSSTLLQHRMGQRLDVVLQRLDEGARLSADDVAQLKQVRDVLLARIPESGLTWFD